MHWRTFIEDLTSRGLRGIELATSDDHPGLRKALQAVLPSVKWQRCLFHLSQNATAYAPSQKLKKEIAGAVRDIYQAMGKEEAIERLRRTVEHFKDKAAKFCNWLEENFIEGLTFFDFPESHWKRIRTVNIIERINQEQKRRTKAVRLFPNVESCERLVVTIAMRIHEEWAVGNRYVTMD